MACASHLFNAPLYVYDVSHVTHTWTAYFPSLTDRNLPRNVNCMSMYIYFTGNHFNVVSGVVLGGILVYLSLSGTALLWQTSPSILIAYMLLVKW